MGRDPKAHRYEPPLRPIVDLHLDLLARPQSNRHAKLGRTRQRLHHVSRREAGRLGHERAPHSDAYVADAGRADNVRPVDFRAIAGSHRQLGAAQLHGFGQAVPPGDDARRKRSVVQHASVGAADHDVNAGFSRDRIVQGALTGHGDGRTRDAPLVHADVGIHGIAQRVGDARAVYRQHAHAAAALCLRVDRVGADQREPLDAPRGQREDTAIVFQQDKGTRTHFSQQRRIDEGGVR